MSTELLQFCILARTQKGRACAALVQQVIAHRKIFVFGDLLDIPSVQALKESEFSNAFKTLELFAFGTIQEYSNNPRDYLELTEVQTFKLRQLSLLTLCAKEKNLSYEKLFAALLLHSDSQSRIRELEDLIIDSINNGLLTAKLNQKKQCLIVISCIARDVAQSEIPQMISIFKLWKERCQLMNKILGDVNESVANNRISSQQEQVEVQHLAENQKQIIKQQIESGEYEDNAEEVAFGPGGGSGLGGMKRSLRTMINSSNSSNATHFGGGRTGRLG